MNRAGQLRHQIAVYAARDARDDTDESYSEYYELRKIWAKIVPVSGRTETIDGDMERMAVTHRVFIRTAALPELASEMYFMYRGQKYEVQYFMPVYNQRGWTEIGCVLTTEKEGVPDGDQWY